MSIRSVVLGASLLPLLAACTTTGVSENKSVVANKVQSDVGFFIIGDTGVIGDEGNLAQTSALVKKKCGATWRCDFGLLSGDNIYPSGATGDPAKDGPTFDTLFIKPFGSLWQGSTKGERLYVALGNHDWYNGRAGAEAQRNFHEKTNPFFMNGYFYSQKFNANGVSIEIFTLDTEMIMSQYDLPKYDDQPDGSMKPRGDTGEGGTKNALPVTEAEKQQVAWFKQALAASTADWKFVLTHHPIWQSRADSKFAQSAKLRELLLPTLCQYADGYFAGHQHSIEVHEDSCKTVGLTGTDILPLPQIVSGAGAKSRTIDPAFQRWQAATYPQDNPLFGLGEAAGYVQAEIKGDALTVTPITVDANNVETVHPSFTFKKRTAW